MSLKKKGIGIFGGSFDPPHKGHLKISKISLKKFDLKKIYWIITKQNPFKKKPFFSLENRIRKSRKILGKNNKIKVLYLDKKLNSTRSIHVINYFIKKKKQKKLYLIIGSDSLINFHRWKSWKKIVKLTNLIVFSRRRYDKKSKNSTVVRYLKKNNIIYVNNEYFDTSSSKIRKKIK